jgi:hypothetical protein
MDVLTSRLSDLEYWKESAERPLEIAMAEKEISEVEQRMNELSGEN